MTAPLRPTSSAAYARSTAMPVGSKRRDMFPALFLYAIRRASSLLSSLAGGRRSEIIFVDASLVVQGWHIGISNTETVVIHGFFALLARHVIALQDFSLGAPRI